MWRQPPPALNAATIAANLANAQVAYDALARGQMTATVSYGEGVGNRSVTYTRAQMGALKTYIEDLQTQQGYRARRAIGLRF
jgi:cupin superfamily acireductone dioxygenase involved in methionine salvage